MGSVLPDNNDKKLYTLSSCAATRCAPDKELLGKVKGVLVPRIEERESLVKKRTGKRGVRKARFLLYRSRTQRLALRAHTGSGADDFSYGLKRFDVITDNFETRQ
jgi:hypothetical protein